MFYAVLGYGLCNLQTPFLSHLWYLKLLKSPSGSIFVTSNLLVYQGARPGWLPPIHFTKNFVFAP